MIRSNGKIVQSFTFDHVAGMDSTQEHVFQKVGKPITETCLAGYNGTVFAYGQTGSGKTYTMQGELDSETRRRRGLMPRIFGYLWSSIRRETMMGGEDGDGGSMVEYTVTATCLEIYQ